MNRSLALLMVLGGFSNQSQAADHLKLVRQEDLASGVVWDMPAPSNGAAPFVLSQGRRGRVVQLWALDASSPREILLDQELVGAHLPAATLKITTMDSGSASPRSRVDQPFTVEIDVSGLLSGADFPRAVSSVLLERQLVSHDHETSATAHSGMPASAGYISCNGKTTLRFEASSLTDADPTKAAGEERFVIHTLADPDSGHTQIAAGSVQIWPVASAEIKGISSGDVIGHGSSPQLKLLLHDLYPRSDTYLKLYNGTQVAGVEGTTLRTFSMDQPSCESHEIEVDDLMEHLPADGTYTLALISDTVFGRELLDTPVTFSVDRPGSDIAMHKSTSPNTGH